MRDRRGNEDSSLAAHLAEGIQDAVESAANDALSPTRFGASYPSIRRTVEKELANRATRLLLPAFAVKLAAARRELLTNPAPYSTVKPADAAARIVDMVSSSADELVDELTMRALALGASSIKLMLHRLGTFLERDGRRVLEGLEFAEADTHNEGNKVAFAVVSGKEKLVYKPINSFPIDLFQCFTKAVLASQGESRPNGVDVTLAEDDFYISRYVDCRQFMKPEISAGDYYHAAGIVLAVSYILGVTDLHFENVICTGSGPVVIDVEAIGHSLSGAFSILDTGLLDRTGLSGLIGGGDIVEFGIFESSDAFGPAVTYQQSNWRAPNRPFTEELKAIDPGDYAEAVLAGFRSAYQLIMQERRSFLRILDICSSKNAARARSIVRSTAFYSMLITHIVQPTTQSADERRQYIRERLEKAPHFMEIEPSAQVIECELLDLFNGDIPYFVRHATERGLFHHSTARPMCPEIPAVSDVLSKNVAALNFHMLNEQLSNIRECLLQPIIKENDQG